MMNYLRKWQNTSLTITSMVVMLDVDINDKKLLLLQHSKMLMIEIILLKNLFEIIVWVMNNFKLCDYYHTNIEFIFNIFGELGL